MEPEIMQKPLRQRVPGWARVLLQLTSFVLCILLLGNLFGLIITADLRQAIGREGFRDLVDSIFTAYFEELREPRAATPDRHSKQPRSAQPYAQEEQTPDFSDPDALVDWAYGMVQEAMGGEVPIEKEAVRDFLAESTVKDHLADKLADSVASLLESGTVGDLVTDLELENLILENKDLVAEKFGVELTPEKLESITGSIQNAVEQADVNGKFQTFVEGLVKGEEPILFGITAQDVLSFIATRLTSELFRTQLITCIVLVALLCLANFYNVPAGLTWAAFPCMIAGGIMVLATGLLNLPQQLASVQPVADTVKAMIAPVHYAVLGLGVALLVVSILWRILRSSRQTMDN